MAGQNIDAAFAAILKDCQAIAAEAVKNSAKKVQNDVLKEADDYLQRYYSNYNPTYYKPRSKQLQKSITPVLEDRSSNTNISIEVGVEYDSTKLKGVDILKWNKGKLMELRAYLDTKGEKYE